MSILNFALVFNMSSSNAEVTAKAIQKQFFILGRRVTLLQDYQRRLRFAGNDWNNTTRDHELIELKVDLTYGTKTYEEGLFETLKLTDDILKESIARVEELKKIIDK